jgi:hypothetical protein
MPESPDHKSLLRVLWDRLLRWRKRNPVCRGIPMHIAWLQCGGAPQAEAAPRL